MILFLNYRTTDRSIDIFALYRYRHGNRICINKLRTWLRRNDNITTQSNKWSQRSSRNIWSIRYSSKNRIPNSRSLKRNNNLEDSKDREDSFYSNLNGYRRPELVFSG